MKQQINETDSHETYCYLNAKCVQKSYISEPTEEFEEVGDSFIFMLKFSTFGQTKSLLVGFINNKLMQAGIS